VRLQETQYLVLLSFRLWRARTTTTRVLACKQQWRRTALVSSTRIGAALEKSFDGGGAARSNGAVQRGDAAVVQ